MGKTGLCLRAIASLFLIAAAALLLPSFDNISPSESSRNIPSAPVDFRSVAKKAIPAVVSIKVKLNQAKKSLWDSDSSSEDEELEQLWRRFFGVGGSKRRQAETSPQKQPFSGLASGFIVSADGYILTNSHVVESASEVAVTLEDGRDFTAKVIGFDTNIDIALLKIDADNLPHLSLGNSDALEVGEWVAAIGNPLGLQASLTVGVVSATGRNNLDITRVEDFIQTDASINRGNSGGPLLDLQGEVMGINTAIVTNMANGGYMGIGFAIPSNMAKHVMEELRATGRVTRGFVGFLLQPIDRNLAQSFNLPNTHGALVSEVTKGSPAEAAGIKSGDIVTKFNGKAILNIASLRNAISLMTPSSKGELTILRNGETLDLPVEIAEFPGTGKKGAAQYEKLGFEVENSSGSDEEGIIDSKVAPNSIASWAGLKAGAQIVEVNQKKIASVHAFQKELADTPEGRPILLLVKQGGLTRFISLRVE
jgi:serine protease Do